MVSMAFLGSSAAIAAAAISIAGVKGSLVIFVVGYGVRRAFWSIGDAIGRPIWIVYKTDSGPTLWTECEPDMD